METIKRSYYDGLVDQINDLATNPPEGCEGVATLDHLPAGPQPIRKSQLITLRAKLTEICRDNEFEDLQTPQVIKKSHWDEIEAAISNGWCGCDECPTKPATDQDGLEVVLFNPAYTVYPNFDDPGGPYPLGSWPVASNIEGYALAIPGFRFRSWSFTAWNGPNVRYQRSGSVRPNGTVDASNVPPGDTLEEHVFSIVGGSCTFADPDTGEPTPECADTLAEVEGYVQRYVLRLNSVLAECDDNPS